MNSKLRRHQEHQYLDLGKEILKNGIDQKDRGTGVVTRSVFGIRHVYDLEKSFPLLTTKKVYWNGVIQELYWFLSGQTNIKYLVDHNVHIWDDYPYKIFLEKSKSQKSNRKSQILTKEEFIEKIAKSPSTSSGFAARWGNLPHIYGEMWRHWPTRKKGKTVDQLQWVIDEVKADPNAHNLIVNSWNPEYLYTMADHEDASRFPICHNMYQVSNRHGKLDLLLYQRSCDYFLGVPFNIASYALLCVILAKILGLKPGRFIHVYGDIHIYENHFDQVKEQLKRKPNRFPKVRINGKVNSLADFKPEMVELIDYKPLPGIKADLTVAGGFYEKKSRKKIIPSAAALAIKDNQILLVREEEASGHMTGKYGLPGGHVDEGESEILTAAREFCEETGLSASEDDFEAFPGNYFEADIPRKDGIIVHFGWRVFHCKRFSGNVTPSKQTTPQWIDFDEARKMQKEGKLHANTLEALENYLKFISN